ncbi:MAG: hypothetical protein JO111_13580 [Caulobacteraceae bacterium]|nr:hypothetical protein [Caulobacteraceae bacterium]
MEYILEHPGLVLITSLLMQGLGAYVGHVVGGRWAETHVLERSDYRTIISATLTLLALLIGFSLTMAVNRYDLRKTYEEAEANAISSEFRRVSVMPNAAEVRDLLIRYTDLRIQFYQVRHRGQLKNIVTETRILQDKLWSSVAPTALAQPPAVTGLVLSGMNDAINAENYAEAAWRNHIPVGAWFLMGFVAVVANVLLGYGEEHKHRSTLTILPFIVSAAFFLISDVDSPNYGLIRMPPNNLIALAQTLKAHAPG